MVTALKFDRFSFELRDQNGWGQSHLETLLPAVALHYCPLLLSPCRQLSAANAASRSALLLPPLVYPGLPWSTLLNSLSFGKAQACGFLTACHRWRHRTNTTPAAPEVRVLAFSMLCMEVFVGLLSRCDINVLLVPDVI